MKKSLIPTLIFSFAILFTQAAPIEFQAEIAAITEDDEGTYLTVMITPQFPAKVRITGLTEIKDETGLPSSVDALEPGQWVEIEALFTDDGLLALEIKIQDVNQEFELKGNILEILPQAIVVQGFEIQIRETTVIIDSNGDPLEFEQLVIGQGVRVAGFFEEDQLIAHRIKVISNYNDFSRVSFEGVITAMTPGEPLQITVAIEGNVETLVEISDKTDVKGELAVGAYVKVIGFINSDLHVTALRVRVRCLVEFSPDELELQPETSAPVSLVLRSALENELIISLVSEDPEIAVPGVENLTIPAGEMSASFEVTASSVGGKTRIMAVLPSEYGECVSYLKVEVEGEDDDDADGDDDEEPKELAVMWTPRTIKAAPQGSKQVNLHLKYGPIDDSVVIGIDQVSGDEDFVKFPETVEIRAGMNKVRFNIDFLKQSGYAVLEAKLPEDLGGSTDRLIIDLAAKPVNLRLRWSPKQIKVEPDTEFEVELILNPPATESIEVDLVVKEGDDDLIYGLPSSLAFARGESKEILHLKSVDDETGRVRIRAVAPEEFGGKHADLKIQVRD